MAASLNLLLSSNTTLGIGMVANVQPKVNCNAAENPKIIKFLLVALKSLQLSTSNHLMNKQP